MNHIYLIGFMGCGKSTVARALKELYHMEILEMDSRIEEEEGKTIADIFAEHGEKYFRKLETELLKRLGGQKNLVISCGGGTATVEENVLEMKKHGKIVLLQAEPETVYERVHTSHNRPLLENNMNTAYICALMEKRRPGYEAAADFAVRTDGKGAGEIASEIMKKIGQSGTTTASKPVE